MLYVEASCRTALGLVFVIAFFGKARNRSALAAFAETLRDLGWLSRPAWAAAAVAVTEAAVAVLLAIPATVTWGFAAGAVVLGGFTLITGAAISRGQSVRCRCFGVSETPMSARHLLRNAILIASALLGWLASAGVGGSRANPGVLTAVIGVACLAGLLMVGWDELAYLITSTGRPGQQSRWAR